MTKIWRRTSTLVTSGGDLRKPGKTVSPIRSLWVELSEFSRKYISFETTSVSPPTARANNSVGSKIGGEFHRIRMCQKSRAQFVRHDSRAPFQAAASLECREWLETCAAFLLF